MICTECGHEMDVYVWTIHKPGIEDEKDVIAECDHCGLEYKGTLRKSKGKSHENQ